MANTIVLNSFLYLTAWYFLVHSVAEGFAWEGELVALIVVAVHLYRTEYRFSELTLILFSMLAGFVIESALVYCDIVAYASPNKVFPHLAPLWLTGLYAVFTTTINYSLARFGVSFMTAAIFGFAGSIISYYAGYRLGAAEFLMTNAGSLLVIGSVWFFFLPLLYKVNKEIIHFRESHVH